MKRFLTFISNAHLWCCLLIVMLLCAVPAQAQEKNEERSKFSNDITINFVPDPNDCNKCKVQIYLLYAHRDEDGDYDGGWRLEDDDEDAKDYGAHVYIDYLTPEWDEKEEKKRKSELMEFCYLYFTNDDVAEILTIDTLYFGQRGVGHRNLYNEFVEQTGFNLEKIWWLDTDLMGVKPRVEHDSKCTEKHYYYVYFEFTVPVYYLNSTMRARVKGKWWRWGLGWEDENIENGKKDAKSGTVTSDPLTYEWKLGELNNARFKVDSNGDMLVTCDYSKGNCVEYLKGKLTFDGVVKKEFIAGDFADRSAYNWRNIGAPGFLRWKNGGSTPTNQVITYSCDLTDSIPHIVKPTTRITLGRNGVKEKSTSSIYYGYPVVTSVKTDFNPQEKSVTVRWDTLGLDTLPYVSNGHWVLERKGSQDTDFEILQPLPLSQTSFKDLSIYFQEHYQYRVYYRHNDWTENCTSVKKMIGETDEEKSMCTSPVISTSRKVKVEITGTTNDNTVFLKIKLPKVVGARGNGLYNVALYRDDRAAALANWSNITPGDSVLEYNDVSSPDNILTKFRGHTYTVKVTATRPAAYQSEIVGIATGDYVVTGRPLITNLTASQGDYTDRIVLNWESPRGISDTNTDTCVISRQLLMRDEVTYPNEFIKLGEILGFDRFVNFSDETAEPGKYYRYKVEMLDGDSIPIYSLYTIGYVNSRGTIAGNVTYQDGTALADARLDIKALNAKNNNLFQNYQRSIFVNDDSLAINISSREYDNLKKKHTIQFWYLGTGEKDDWQHISISGSTILRSHYNHETRKIETKKITENDLPVKPVFVDSRMQIQLAKGFVGNIDELQVWKREFSQEELARYATMRLSGKEDGLIAYYPFDDGLPDYAFNHAYDGSKRSKMLINLGINVTTSTSVPDAVSFCTYTDANGSYLFSDVPLEDDGTLYSVAPSYGEHDFEPMRIQRYISKNSLVYNGVDFEDRSSFLVQGTVTYRYGDFPVEGASIYVDGKQATRNEEPILTDAEGRYRLDIPVGYHSITVKMKDHEFADGGRFPAQADVNYDFQQPMYVNFVDTTTVAIAGRVAGGHSMAHLPMAAHTTGGSRANIGKATLYLAPLSNRNYTVNVSESDAVTMPRTNDSIQSTTTLLAYERNGHQAGQIRIETDPATGEFCALLPPLKYKVVRGETKSVSNEQLRAYDAPQINPVVGKTYTDSMVVVLNPSTAKPDTVIQYFTYNSKVIIQYDTRPLVEISQTRFEDEGLELLDNDALGELYIPGMDDEYIPAFEVAFGEVDYTLKDEEGNGYPVFASGADYILNVHAYQEFVNKDNGEDEKTQIPLSGSSLSLSSFEWGTPSSINVPFNKDGYATFRFNASEPIISEFNDKSGDFYTRGMNLGVTTSTRTYVFPEDGKYEAVFMGFLMDQGSMVVAEGPDIVEFVLRDPPGSESFSTLEKGSSYTTKISTVTKDEGGSIVKESFSGSIGGKWKNTEGQVNMLKIAPEEEYKHSNKTATTTTKVTTQQVSITNAVSTGSDPQHVGSQGDVYIGTSVFHCFGPGYNYTLHDEKPRNANVKYHEFDIDVDGEAKTYYLYPVGTVGTGNVLSGQFAFSQRYIQETLIPRWKKLRNSLLWPVGTKDSVFVWKENEALRFISKYSPDDPLYGSNDSYEICKNPTPTSGVDSIKMINNWIRGWEETISANEYRKVSATYDHNQTISNGVSYSESKTTTSFKSIRNDTITSDNTVILHGAKVNFEYGGDGKNDWHLIGGINISCLGGSDTTHVDQGGNVDTDASHLKISYTMQDNDLHDYLHVKIDTISFATEGYRFFLDGGATTRPWEGPEKTLYYNAGMSDLSYGTLMVDKPRMSIKNRVVTDVPNGRETSIELQLGNASEIHAAASYRLFLDDATNPDGLQITCDGYPITGDGHLLNFRPDETYTKVLKIRQSRLDVMDYNDVGLYFHAPTYQYFESKNPDINPQLTFSVHYKPSCSDVSLAAFDQWQNKIQAVNLGTDSKIVLRASDYNRNYNGFYKLAIERKGEYETQWTPIHVWALDSAVIDSFPELRGMEVIDSSSVSYIYDMAPLADQHYMFRAVTHGRYGTEEVTFEGDTVTIVKDMKAPQVMAFTPTNGILTADDDISVLFNEEVLSTGIVSSNIKVTGVLNEHELTHQDGIRFSNSQNEPVHTTADVSLSGSFSIEMWISGGTYSQSTLFKHTLSENGLKFGFDSMGRFWVNDLSQHSDIRVSPSRWSYLAVTVDGENDVLHAYMFYTDTKGVAHQDELLTLQNFSYSARGHIYIGEKMEGMISGVTIWNKLRDMTDMADRSKAHTGRELGLSGYWPMDEGHGNVAADKAGGRNLTIPSANRWYVSEGNYAAHFNADKQSYIRTGAIAIGDDEDYSLEFWFNSQSDKGTLLQMGKGRFFLKQGALHYQNDYDKNTSTSTAQAEGEDKTEDGQLYNKYVRLVRDHSNDGDWHHFAMRVQRGTSVSFFYDGKFTMFGDEDMLASMNVDAYTLGASCWIEQVDSQHVNHHYEDFLTGSIDELRVWRANLSSQALLANQYAHIDSAAAGLVMNYAFDHNYYREQTQSWGVQGDTDDHSIYHLPNEASNVTTSSQAPSLTAVALEEPVAFDWVANKEKVVLTITEPKQRIEGCTLNFSIDRVRDMNGNTLTAPVKWSAFVNLNRLVWSEKEAELQTVYGGEQASVTVDVTNNGSEMENWKIEDIPSWLICSQESGTLTPQTYSHIKFTTREGTPIGYYEATVCLTGNNGVREPLRISLTVTGEAPDWSVDPSQFEYSDNLTATMMFGGFISEDKNDMVAAFVGDTCVGVAHPRYIEELDNYLVMMTLYGNDSIIDRAVSFKAWQASTGMIHPFVTLYDDKNLKEARLTKENTVYGTPVSPWYLEVGEAQENRINLYNGWNWISVNLYSDDESMKPENFFKGTSVDYFKNQEHFAERGKNLWWGDSVLTDVPLSPKQMYVMRDTQDEVITIKGLPVKSQDFPVTIHENWNWIGYTPQVPIDLTTALASADPQEGDLIKGQRLFAYYTQKQWVGTMEYMEPGQGYLYKSMSKENKLLYYPDTYNTVYSAPAKLAPRREASGAPQWDWNPYNYSTNMTVTATVTLDGQPVSEGMVGAFDEAGICRGYKSINTAQGLLYLLISGDEICNLSLRLWDAATGEIHEMEAPFRFIANQTLGNVGEPYQLHFGDTSGIHEISNEGENEDERYDLSGRHADKDAKGIIITTGKKQIIK